MRVSLAISTAAFAALLLISAAPGCGDDRSAQGPEPSANQPLQERREGRLVVAEVNGQPVFADCVSTQAAETGADRATALDQCVDFELLAQAAEKRGYANRPEVLQTQRREAVRAFIDTDFLPTFDGPEDVPEAAVKRRWKKEFVRYNHPELRFAAHALIQVDRSVTPGSPTDLAARDIALALRRKLAGKRWDKDAFLDRAELFRARRLLSRLQAGLDAARSEPDGPRLGSIVDLLVDVTLEPPIIVQNLPNPFPANGGGRYSHAFASGAFAIPEEGMISPPVRTKRFGWHIILLTKILPEEHGTLADHESELRKDIFLPQQQIAFQRWVRSLTAKRKIEVFDKALAQMVESERARNPLSKLDESEE